MKEYKNRTQEREREGEMKKLMFVSGKENKGRIEEEDSVGR